MYIIHIIHICLNFLKTGVFDAVNVYTRFCRERVIVEHNIILFCLTLHISTMNIAIDKYNFIG